MSMKRLSLSPSFGSFSMKSSAITARNKPLDPTIVNNDLEMPHLTEARQRPAPDFVSIRQRKPKLLKATDKAKISKTQVTSPKVGSEKGEILDSILSKDGEADFK